MTDKVIIKEVSPRDGLQAQAVHLSVEQRVSLIRALAQTGLPEIEIGSFVSPKAVPQMAGSDEIAGHFKDGQTRFSALVPNLKGYERARAAGIDTVAIVLSATEQMNQNNIRMSLDQTFAMGDELMLQAARDGVAVHAYLAVAFECPYEGRVAAKLIVEQCARIMAASPARLVIADTIGAADPVSVARLMDVLVREYGADRLACHFHDTRALAVANAYAAMNVGVRHFDSSAGGLGGCPFAPGARGNIATEDLLLLCAQTGFDTGVDLGLVMEAVSLISSLMGAPQGGRAFTWLERNWQKVEQKYA